MFYAPGSHFDCHESVDDPVQDKERANFCSSFSLRRDWSGCAAESKSAESKAAAAKKAFDALFG